MGTSYTGCPPPQKKKNRTRGGSRILLGGGGGRESLCAPTHNARAKPRSPLRPGSRARLRTLAALGVFDTLSCYLSHILRILIQNGIKKYSIKFKGGGAPKSKFPSDTFDISQEVFHRICSFKNKHKQNFITHNWVVILCNITLFSYSKH